MNNPNCFYINRFSTVLGEMTSVTDDNYLYFLKFSDQKNAVVDFKKIERKHNTKFLEEPSKISSLIEKEIADYFQDSNHIFITPINYQGTNFQEQVWKELFIIPSGTTTNYKTLAQKINKLNAQRAIGNCVGANHLAIIVPCHRVIRSDGQLGGYNGGIARKEWLLKHENNK